MPLTPVAGQDIWVARTGNGTPALMIHCALAKHEALLPLAERLPYQSTLFDMPGHGRSADRDGTTDYQKQITGIAAALCDQPTHVIGHSFGATAALRLAVEQPARVNRLTLIEPVFFAAARNTPAHKAHQVAFRPFVAAMLEGDDQRAAQVFHGMWGDDDWGALSPRRQEYLTARIHLIVAGASAIEGDEDGITSQERLSKLTMPVTLIRGANSPGVIAAIHTVLGERIPYSKDHAVKGAGHMLPMTHAEEIAAIIRAADQETAARPPRSLTNP